LFAGSDIRLNKKPKEEKHCGFQVKLQRLIGGFGGNTQTQTLYFPYTTPFTEFLDALREATSLCTIPPEDSNEKKFLNFRKPSQGHNEVEVTETALESQNITTVTLPESSVTKPASPDSHSAKNTLLPPRNLKGYLLTDGDWIYKKQKIHLRGDKKICIVDDSDARIRNEFDYWTIVKTLRAANTAKEVPEFAQKEISTPNRISTSTCSDRANLFGAQYDHRFTHELWMMHVRTVCFQPFENHLFLLHSC
jgi:hypothetical protein